MNKKIIVFLFLVSGLKSINAQNYIEESYRFNVNYSLMVGFYHRGEYVNAAQYSDSLIGNHFLTKYSTFFIAKVYACDFDYLKTMEFLEKSVKLGITKEQIEITYDLEGFLESNKSIILELNYNKWHQEYLNSTKNISLDTSYINSIAALHKSYQKANHTTTYFTKNDSIYRLHDSLTSYNFKDTVIQVFNQTTDLIITKGFPTQETIGNEFFNFSRLLKYSMPNNYSLENPTWLKIKQLIGLEMAKGNIAPYYYATLLDQHLSNKKQPVRYATSNFYYPKNIKFEKPEELNIRRKSVGLEPITLHFWKKVKELPESLKNITFK